MGIETAVGIGSAVIGAGTSIAGAMGGGGGGAYRDQAAMSSQLSIMDAMYSAAMAQIQSGVAKEFAETQGNLAEVSGEIEARQHEYTAGQYEDAAESARFAGTRTGQEERRAFAKVQGSARAQTAAAGVSLDPSGSYGDMIDAGSAEYRQAQDTIRYDTDWAVKENKDQMILANYLADLSRWSGKTNSQLVKAGGNWSAAQILTSGMTEASSALAGGMLSSHQLNIQADAADSAKYTSMLTGLGRAAEYGISSLKYLKKS